MAMTLRLSEEETELLRRQAEREHRSMHEVVRLAVMSRIEGSLREATIRESARSVIERDALALKLLSE